MRRLDLQRGCRWRQFVLGGLGLIMLGLAGLGWGCQPRSAVRAPFRPPPAEYQRQLLLVLEDQNFRPLAGVPVAVEFQEGRSLSPVSARTASDGSLRLAAKPLIILGMASNKGGDLFLDYRTRLQITLWPGETRAVTFDWTDQQSYAYYQDPLYEGQNRRPWEGEEIINFTLDLSRSGRP